MESINDILVDLSIARALLLERVKQGIAKEVESTYKAMIDDITKQVKSSKPINQARLKQTIADIKAQLKSIELDLTLKYQDLAEQERDWLISSTNAAAGVSLFTTIPTVATLNTIARTSLVEGATVTAWLQSLDKSMQFDAQRAITLGVSLGETNEQLAKRLSDTLTINKNQAKTLVVTGAAAVSNDARFAVYDANKDVMKGWQHQSVLDSKTTQICATRDGAAWDTEYKGLNAKGRKFAFRKPPLHFNSIAKGEKVLTINGYKNIEDIRVGDYVYTHKSRFKKVLNVMYKTCDNGVIRTITNDVGIAIRVTDEHPLLSPSNGWGRADTFKIGDELYYCSHNLVNIRVSGRATIANPKNYPALFNSEIIPYFFSLESINMPSSIRLYNYLMLGYSKITNTITQNKLVDIIKFIFIKSFNKWNFRWISFFSLNLSHRLQNFNFSKSIFNRVISFHSFRMSLINFTSFFCHTISPMIRANTDASRKSILHTNRCHFSFRQSFNIMLNSPFAQSAICQFKLSLYRTKRFLQSMVMLKDKILKKLPIFKIKHFYTSKINDICIVAYNDLVYNIEVEEDNSYLVNGVIVHNCRSQIVPIFKSWQELGLDIPESDTATRASMDGYLSQDITFDKWFETKSPKFQETYLGRGRYQLYKDGKITFNDLVDGKGNELTLKELRDKFS